MDRDTLCKNRMQRMTRFTQRIKFDSNHTHTHITELRTDCSPYICCSWLIYRYSNRLCAWKSSNWENTWLDFWHCSLLVYMHIFLSSFGLKVLGCLSHFHTDDRVSRMDFNSITFHFRIEFMADSGTVSLYMCTAPMYYTLVHVYIDSLCWLCLITLLLLCCCFIFATYNWCTFAYRVCAICKNIK